MSVDKKITEALEYIQSAEKHLKTSFLKWKPDYDSAADDYNKAATCYRNAKKFNECKDCLLKAVECHKENGALFYAAKALDQCIIICKELNNYSEIGALAERAANMFQRQGNAESATATLDKAGKILESQYPSQALQLFKHASEIATIQDNARQAAEYTDKVARLHVKLKEFDAAANAIQNLIQLYQQLQSFQVTGRAVVGLVLVEIAKGDIVAGDKSFREWGNYCDPAEIQTLESLIQAYHDQDADTVNAALNSPFIKHMDVEYAILARDMSNSIPFTSNSAEGTTDQDNIAAGSLC